MQSRSYRARKGRWRCRFRKPCAALTPTALSWLDLGRSRPALRKGERRVSSPAFGLLAQDQQTRRSPSFAGAAGLCLRVRPPPALVIAIEAATGAAEQSTEQTMSTIGTFTQAADGGYAGSIRTLNLHVEEVAFRPETPASDKAPDFRIVVDGLDVGAAWKKTSRENNPYLAVKLDDPSLPAPIYASLVSADDGFALIWSRARSRD